MNKNSIYKIIAISVIAALAFIIAKSVWEILCLSISQWNEPILFGDSWRLTTTKAIEGAGIHSLLSQHNEHRIVLSKAAALFETNVLNIPLTQTALLQTMILLIFSCLIWAYLCSKILTSKAIWTTTSLAGSALILNPWQYENFAWEFQTPWIFINTLTLFAAVAISFQKKAICRALSMLQDILIAAIPWIAIFSTGQGIALGLALSICSWTNSRRLGVISTTSFILTMLSTYFILDYQKPSHHPDYQFNPYYFLKISTGGSWQGLSILIIISALVLAVNYKSIKTHLSIIGAVLIPFVFSIIFAGMTTLSRSGFGIGQANSPRYVSHSLMTGLSCILIVAICSQKRSSQLKLLNLAPGILTLIAFTSFNVGGIAQDFTNQWENAKNFQEKNRSNFKCLGKRINLKKRGIEHTCLDGPHHHDIANEYFKGKTAIKPLGWHKKLIN